MRIALNASPLLNPLTGIGQYCFHLISNLLQHADLELDLFYGNHWSKQLPLQHYNATTSMLPWIRNNVPYAYQLRRKFQQLNFNKNLTATKPDIYHELCTVPLNFNGKSIVTVHDIAWIRHPQVHPPKRVKALNQYFENGLQSASSIITDSEFIKNELLDLYNIDSNKISCIPLGVNSIYKPQSLQDTKFCLDQYKLSYGNFFITVGTLEPRKNIKLVLSAYQKLSATIRNSYPLVVVGMKGWFTDEIEAQMAPLLSTGQIRLLGYVPSNDLASLVASAKALIYPSIYEGFGLPPLEAMACGTPVICSNTSSLPEVVGNAALLVSPSDVQGMCNSIEKLVESPELTADLSAKGLIQASLFSWSECANKTAMVYKKLLSI